MKIAFYTLGCKVNTYETESIYELFKNDGYKRVDYKDYADVYIINTCTVTNNGDAKSRKAIRQAIKRNPEAVIAVMGCYSQMSPDEVLNIDGVDIVIGTKQREQLPRLVQEVINNHRQITNVDDILKYRVFDETNVTNFAENTRAFLKIEDGCNNFCTYCIIPFARGPVRSRPLVNVIDEAKRLVRNGYKEIVLTGIHTGGYGKDLPDTSFYDLLLALTKVEGLKRIRISSIEMNELTEEIITLIANNDIFAKHLHIPLQSGSNDILKAMKRHYSKEDYLDKLNSLRSKIDNLAITTDIIVGFPRESKDHFIEMKEFIIKSQFSELHVFPYSKRSGTKAALMKDQVNGIEKSLRVNELLQINEQLATSFLQLSPQIQSVIFETSDDEFTYGHSDTYLKIKVEKDVTLHNEIKNVELLTRKYQQSFGKIKD